MRDRFCLITTLPGGMGPPIALAEVKARLSTPQRVPGVFSALREHQGAQIVPS
jgi:hypothetical protein